MTCTYVFSEAYSAVELQLHWLLSDSRFCTLKRKEGQGHPTGSKNSVIVRKKTNLKFRIILVLKKQNVNCSCCNKFYQLI